MMAELLKTQIEKILQEQAAGDVRKTLYVLKGVSLETVDPENAGKPDLEKLLDNKLMYLFGIQSQGRRFVTFEEFLLLGSLTAELYDAVIILDNNLWMNLYPLDLSCSPELIRGLLNHALDPDDASADQEICSVEALTDLFGDVRPFGDGYIGAYAAEKLPDSGKIRSVRLFLDTERKLAVRHTAESFMDLVEETDYISLVQSVFSAPQEIVIRTAGWSGDQVSAADLNRHLRMLAACCGDQGKLCLLQPVSAGSASESRPEFTEILHQYWGADKSFREIPVYNMASVEEGGKDVGLISQERVITDLVRQVENCGENRDFRDVFVTASTGSGKSAMFQIPAIYLAEKYNLMTIVISPLISLMNDQIVGLEKRGYTRAKTLNSDISPVVKEEIRRKVADGEYHILYLSPETLLARSDVEQLIGDRTIGMIVVDEAHIVTTWGKQFRPDYWYLGDHIKKLRRRQKKEKGRSFVISTFTATAIYHGPEDMYQETINSLQMINPITYLGFVKRDDIDIVITKQTKEKGGHTEYEPSKFGDVEALVQRAVITGRKTLIYFPTVSLIRQCWNQLYIDQMTANVCCYYGPMLREEKQDSYEKFRAGDKLVMLATKAFGMGVDIPDIAIVSHFAPTGNVCDYVQEIGRAARAADMRGEAVYKYYSRDFKHINRLHGLSSIREYQLIEVMRKMDELYRAHLTENRNNFTRKRNEMLLDAENFAYIFPSPREEQDESINKVKTALLMIQKDLESRRGYPPVSVRPIPLFADGFFQVEPASQRRLLKAFPGCLEEIDRKKHICEMKLDKIWKADRDASTHSFPQFKFLLYSRSTDLELNRNYTLIPALCVSVTDVDRKDRYRDIIRSVKGFINKRIVDGTQAHAGDMAKALQQDCPHLFEYEYNARTVCEVILASMESWQHKYSKSHNAAMIVYHDNAGRPRYGFNVAINSWFGWLDRLYTGILKETEDEKLYLVNDGSTLIQETAAVLGVLESLGALSFKMNGGANSQIYIYVNQIQPIRNILKRPWSYENRLLKMVAERHTVSVKMLTYLYEHEFTSQERWNLLEDYFLGRIPEEVQQEVEKEKARSSDIVF